jgi:DNA recombination protein RmuC
MRSRVLIATPVSLLGLLHTIAYGWQQEREAENSRKIADAGAELYSRLAGLAEAIAKIGDRLGQATTAYNGAIGTLERRVLPSAKKIKELQSLPDDDIPEPKTMDVEVRPIVHPELQKLPTEAASLPSSS